MDEATLDEWKGLYDLAATFKELAPWTWMEQSDVFAVQSPADGELSYCVVLGSGGQEFGLGMFVGEDGFEGYRRLMEGEVEAERLETGVMLRSLSLTFVDRRYLDRRDHTVIKALGAKFRGRNAWPLFRSQRPGYAPWYLEREEVQLLDIALRFTMEVAEEVRNGSLDLSAGADEDQVYTLLTAGKPRRQRTPLPEKPRPSPPPQPDAVRLESLRKQSGVPRGKLQADCFLLPAIITDEGERPYYLCCLLVVQEDGFILGTQILPPWAPEAERQEAFVTLLEHASVVPETVVVPSADVLRLVQPVVETLGGWAAVRDAPALEAIRGGLIQELVGA